MPVIINGSTGISGVDGSAATPAIQGTDVNTGIFYPAADTIAFGEGGAEVMRIDSSGFVGIGTTAPSAMLQVTTLKHLRFSQKNNHLMIVTQIVLWNVLSILRSLHLLMSMNRVFWRHLPHDKTLSY